jgi:hypothetical protein
MRKGRSMSAYIVGFSPIKYRAIEFSPWKKKKAKDILTVGMVWVQNKQQIIGDVLQINQYNLGRERLLGLTKNTDVYSQWSRYKPEALY